MAEEDKVGFGGIRVPDYLRPTYANYVNVNQTPWDFRLTFCLVKAPMPGVEEEDVKKVGAIEPEAIADILIPANLIHGLITALTSQYENYIQTYGPPGMDPKGPEFKG